LKVADLRKELDARAISSKGLKAQLTARLQKAIDDEEDKEKIQDGTVDAEGASTGNTIKTSGQDVAGSNKAKDFIQIEAPASETAALEAEKQAPVAAAVKELSDQDKRRLKRMYALPEHPAVLIHPNPVAKGGKFDCHRMSLASLLDYRHDDTREHTFEVSLFAEQFNEMLTRDFVFRIYRALVAAPDKEVKEAVLKQQKELEKTVVTAPLDENAGAPMAKKVKSESESASHTAESTLAVADEAATSTEVKEHIDAAEGNTSEGAVTVTEENEEKSELVIAPRKVHRTVDAGLLLAFTYIDINQIGYLQDRDMEELLQTLGLLLSRAQVRKLVQKVVTKRDMVHYRSLSDKDVVEGQSGDITESRPASLIEDADDVLQLNSILLGNKSLLKQLCRESRGAGLAVVNAEALAVRTQKLEIARSALQVQFDMCCSELKKMREKLGRAETSETRLYKETQDLRDKLRVQRKAEDTARQNSALYQKLLKNSKNSLDSVLKEINMQFDKERREKERREERERERHEKERLEKETAKAPTKDGVSDSAAAVPSASEKVDAAEEPATVADVAASSNEVKRVAKGSDTNGKEGAEEDDEEMMAMMEGEGFEVVDTV